MGAQGKTTDRVLVSVGTGEEVSAESLLVAMSRARQEAKFWCQQRNVLLERVEVSNAQRNPSELLQEQGIKLKVPSPPIHIGLNDGMERVEGSAIAPDVAAANAQLISGREQKGILLPVVPDRIARQVYQRHNITPSAADLESGFWGIVSNHPEIDLTIVEGKTAAEALISQGDMAIALPSVTGGYRSRDQQGHPLRRRVLHPELAVFAQRGRQVHLAFGQDATPATVRHVRRELVRTGELLDLQGCQVDCVQWKSTDGKGPDDLIVNQGPRAWRQAVDHAVPLGWEYERHYRDQYQSLREMVLKREGKPQDQRKLDVEIARYAQRPDAIQVMGQSDQVRGLKAKGDPQALTAARDYIKSVATEAIQLRQRIVPKAQPIRIRH